MHQPIADAPPATAVSPQIPYVRSMAARRNVTSFLDLPAELRNDIYMTALVLSDPLNMIAGRVYRHIGDENHDLISIGEPCKAGDRDLEPADLVQVALPNHAIIFACRQIYHEATSIFFSQNVFVMSRPICDTMKDCFPNRFADPHGAFLAESADWLVNIGSSLPKLQQITIDVDAFCNTWTRRSVNGYHLEMLALLRALWSYNWAGKVDFQSPSRIASMRRPCHCRASSAMGSQPLNVDNLNKITASLLHDDLDVRKYGTMLRHVAIHRNKPQGVVVFRSTDKAQCPRNGGHIYNSKMENACLKHCRTFELDHDQHARIINPLTTLLELPIAIRKQIIDYVILHSEPIHVFLKRKGTYKTPGILYANWAISWATYKRYYNNDFILHFEMRTSPLSNMDALYCWMKACAPQLPRLPWGAEEKMASYKGRNVKSLFLNYNISNGESITFENIRLNVAALTRHGAEIGRPGAFVPITIRIIPHLEDGSVGKPKELVFSVHALRDLALDALRKLREAVSSIRNEIRTDHAVGIVVNGYGESVGYAYYGRTEVHPLPWISTEPRSESH